MKPKHYKSVHIFTDNAYEDCKKGNPIIKISISASFPRELIGSFYIPTTTYKLGYKAFINAIKARAKHDLKITFDYNSSSGY